MYTDQLSSELATAKEEVAGFMIDADVSDEAKLIAAAIVQAGLQVSLTIAAADTRNP